MLSKDLISMADLSAEDIWRLTRAALALKAQKDDGEPLKGQSLALLFEKPSLRTKVSFDVAMWQLGGHSIYLSPAEVGIGEREGVEDVAQVLSRMVSGIAARTFTHSTVELLARHATVPVINALSDREHPCQALGDFLTIQELKGEVPDLSIAYVGDANNVANSLLYLSATVGLDFRIASPRGYTLDDGALNKAGDMAMSSGAKITCTQDPREAVKGAHVVYADVWTSMGQEAQREDRQRAFQSYQVDEALMRAAREDAILMHPLPAHHGEEVAQGILYSPQSVVFHQAENRLHAQKALLLELLGGRRGQA